MSSRDLKRILEEEGAAASISLTEEERGILVAIADGATKAEVAESLGVSEETVGTHVEHVIAKLHRHSERVSSSPPTDDESDG